jgi:hypothetical protein
MLKRPAFHKPVIALQVIPQALGNVADRSDTDGMVYGAFAATEGRRFGQRRYRGERCLGSQFVSDLVGQLTYLLEWLGQTSSAAPVVRNFPNAESRLRLAKKV